MTPRSEGSFVHLHQHTEFSMLDGAARVPHAIATAVADGQPAMAITDHGNLYGVLDFYKECRKKEIKPIIGIEAYMAANSRFDRPTRRGAKVDDTGGDADGGEKLYHHLILLAETTEGYHNLIKLATEAYLSGYYYKPRVDWELLERHHEGLIATTGCLGGVVLQALLQDDYALARERAGRLQDIFGRDNLFVEIQDHGLADQRRTNPMLVRLAHDLAAPLVATNDSHYCARKDALAHEALLCVQTGATLDDPKRFKFDSDEHYIKSAAEMRQLFADYPDACDNTLWIAERANVEIEFGHPKLPEIPIPEEFAGATYEERAAKYLRHLTYEGAKGRWGDELPSEVVERLDYELGVVQGMGFPAYFLVVGDLVRHAKEVGIRVGPGRGSAAGSAVAYSLGITNIDPIKYDLLFERFLNPGRKQMPDIDMDFDEVRRGEMIRYASQRYGEDRVAQVVTFSTIKARAAVRDAARVLGLPYAVGDRIAKAMPPLVAGRDTPLWACMNGGQGYDEGYRIAQPVRDMYETDPEAKKAIDIALGLEGLRRQDGIHACAVVITRDPLTDNVPLQRKPDAKRFAPGEEPVVSQYEMHGIEELGLLKMDFLGLRNLTVIEGTLNMVEKATGVRPDIDNVPLEDEKTFEMLRRGDSIGVFQLEGDKMRALMRSLAPTSFDDISALVALYRPGPMAANMHYDYADRKNGRKPVEFLHPDLEDVLSGTYGLMIYQESVMRVAQKIAGYSLEEADNLRKACLPAGSMLLSKTRGYVPIEKVMELADRRVQTIDKTSATSRYAEVADVWPVGVKPVYRLRTATGYEVRATADHRFLIEDEWRQLKDVAPGDLLAVASRATTDGGAKVSDAEVDLAALLISEGYLPDPDGERRVAHFTNTDRELVEAVRSAFRAHFGRESSEPKVYDGVTRITLSRDDLWSLESVVGPFGRSADRAIPQRFVNAPLCKVERFLGLYFCADGWADKAGAHFSSNSRDVCVSLKAMLLRCGIVSNLHSRKVKGYGAHWTLSISDRSQAKAFAQVVSPHLTAVKSAKVEKYLTEWPDRSSAGKIGIPASFLASELDRRSRVTGRSRRDLGIDSTGYVRAGLLHRSTLDGLLYSERLEDLRTGDLLWDTVESVEYVGELPCYDFEMADAERPYAVVDNVLAHNCGKKIRALIQAERQKFVQGCIDSGYGEKLGTQLFDIIEPFADYAFNKSHAVGYGYVAYQTAWLKANYPVEYMTALLTSVKDDKDKTALYLNDCRHLGITVRVPDVNASLSDFSPRVDLRTGRSEILYGLSAVRDVGEGVVDLLLREREANGPFADFSDFCCRVPSDVLNKKTLFALIDAGAFDSLGHPRRGLLLVAEETANAVVAWRRDRDKGMISLFEAFDGEESRPANLPTPVDTEYAKRDLLAREKNLLGQYVSDHPLNGLEDDLARLAGGTITELLDPEDVHQGQTYTVGGVITNLVQKRTKRGDLMATFVLEDRTGSIEVVVFAKTLAMVSQLLQEDAIVLVKGRYNVRDETGSLACSTIEAVTLDGSRRSRSELVVSMPDSSSPSLMNELRKLIESHPGSVPVVVRVGPKSFRLPSENHVDVNDGFLEALRRLVGRSAVRW